MITFYKSENGITKQCDAAVSGCFISVVDPTPEEITALTDEYGLDSGFVKSSLDEEESSRIERWENQILIIVDTPVSSIEDKDTPLFSTLPIGMIITDNYVFTISSKPTRIISEVIQGSIKDINTNFKTQFVLKLLLRIITLFLVYLKQIEKISSQAEHELHDAMKNELILQLLELEKSLVYFSTSLKANQITIEKIHRGRFLKLYEDDQELLDDVLIETRQAIEMSNIYSGILSSMMDAFGSVISNNLNYVMWRLTVITIIMAIPTMIYSFYGMNTTDLPMTLTWFPTVVSLIATILVALVMFKRKKKK